MRTSLLRVPIALALAISFLGAAHVTLVQAYIEESVSGLVPDDSSWALYTVKRWATDSSYGVKLDVLSLPGTNLYVYLRRCTDNNPIGAGTPNNPVVFSSTGVWKQLGPLAYNTCFRMTARKDWTWFWGSTWWTGTLRY